jgi:hypothetical protein
VQDLGGWQNDHAEKDVEEKKWLTHLNLSYNYMLTG